MVKGHFRKLKNGKIVYVNRHMRRDKKFKMLPITKNRDEKGKILTYSVNYKSSSGDIPMEFNSLKEAKIMAMTTEQIKIKKVI